MKRISAGLLLLVMTPGIVEATYYVSPRYRVHYSPYALSYRRSGLVPGGLDYSMYAVDYRHSGLVYEGALYTLYAVTYGSTGLVPGYCAYPVPYCGPYVAVPCFHQVAPRAPGSVKRRSSYAPSAARGTRPPVAEAVRQRDGLDIIRQYLRGKGIDNASINRICRIDGKLISVDFTLADRRLIVKYLNPQEADLLSAKETFKQKAYERYRQAWENYARQYEGNGGDVYQVKASDEQAIIAALNACDKLDAGHGIPDSLGLYAKN
jgi:hypothetical protein